MANVTIFNVSGGNADSAATAGISAGAVVQTVPCGHGKDSRLALRVQNGDETTGAYVKIAAGDGVRKSLGEMDVAVDTGETAYIPLFDTARFKALDDNAITVSLVDASGDPLIGDVLANIQIEAVQL
jgi:hypothetical protein